MTLVQPDEIFGAQTIQLDRGHRMRFAGDVTRTGGGTVLEQALRVSGGTVAPDGTLTTDGLFMTGGTLEVGLGSATVFDRVVTSAAQLAGALSVRPNYTPAASDTFRIVQSRRRPRPRPRPRRRPHRRASARW